MKTILKEHGGMILTGVLAVAVIVLLMNSINIMAVLGGKAKIEGATYESALDSSATDKILTSKKPQIAFRQYQRIKSGEEYDLESVFTITADTGCTFRVNEILTADGDDITGAYPEEAYRFPQRGIYSITVEAEKEDGVKTEKQFFVPVQ